VVGTTQYEQRARLYCRCQACVSCMSSRAAPCLLAIACLGLQNLFWLCCLVLKCQGRVVRCRHDQQYCPTSLAEPHGGARRTAPVR
jgi:hypothetical protein